MLDCCGGLAQRPGCQGADVVGSTDNRPPCIALDSMPAHVFKQRGGCLNGSTHERAYCRGVDDALEHVFERQWRRLLGKLVGVGREPLSTCETSFPR